ncbi:hypothetical protein [Stagnimonas aquatica]|nr:hypothetical protein [Stagnimonas aquatica]
MSLIRLLRSVGKVHALLAILTWRCHAAVAALLFTSPAFAHNGD